MLTYVEKLTLTPWDMVETDLHPLRTNGFNDSAILDINQVTSYYAYVNRLADGLGVEIEPHYDTTTLDAMLQAKERASKLDRSQN